MLRENRGITLLAVVITIVVLLILASVTIAGGSGALKMSKSNSKTTELEIVQHAVLERYSEYKLTNNEALLVGSKITTAEAQAVGDEMEETIKGRGEYYKLNQTDLSNLGITNADDTYIVNYETGEVLNATILKTDSGEALYRSSN